MHVNPCAVSRLMNTRMADQSVEPVSVGLM